MNVRKLTPCVLADTSEERPVPSTNRKRNGWISEVRMRRRSREKRISSRRHTALIARNSLRMLRAGTCRFATSCAGADAGADVGAAGGTGLFVAISARPGGQARREEERRVE